MGDGALGLSCELWGGSEVLRIRDSEGKKYMQGCSFIWRGKKREKHTLSTLFWIAPINLSK